MNILVSAGPSYEPIDKVRRITNQSTGSLGSGLCSFLKEAGHDVTCLIGTAATARPQSGVKTLEFSTGESLFELFKEESVSQTYGAIFHAAAIGDYQLKSAEYADGSKVESSKISSRDGGLLLRLEPANKVLPRLRPLFPEALIVGWKYELEGTPDDVTAKGIRQLTEARNDAVVLNGSAWGEGFGLLHKNHKVSRYVDAPALYQALLKLVPDL